MKRIISAALILSLTIGTTGCETIQRKFTRKKKRKILTPRFYQEGLEDTRSNLELYIMHYTYWKTWQDELITNSGKNAKRDTMASNELIGHLNDMKRYLVEEKSKELDSYLEQIKKIINEISKGGLTTMRLELHKQRLGNIKGRIMRKFYYKKIKDYIKPD